jgi:hypothetical protein
MLLARAGGRAGGFSIHRPEYKARKVYPGGRANIISDFLCPCFCPLFSLSGVGTIQGPVISILHYLLFNK